MNSVKKYKLVVSLSSLAIGLTRLSLMLAAMFLAAASLPNFLVSRDSDASQTGSQEEAVSAPTTVDERAHAELQSLRIAVEDIRELLQSQHTNHDKTKSDVDRFLEQLEKSKAQSDL